MLTLVRDVKTTEADCSRNMDNVNSIGGCIADVEGVVNAVEDIMTQIKSGTPNFSTLIQDAETVVSDAKAAESDCSLFVETPEVRGIEQCIQDIEGIVNSALDIMQQIKSG